jgi:lipoprotein-anchoring transpeptidase ErfK/SrfK
VSPDEPNELERLLGEAFDARARAEVPDHRQPPPMRLPDHLSPYRHSRSRARSRSRWLAPLAAAAAVLVAVAVAVGVNLSSTSRTTRGAVGPGSLHASSGATPTHSPSGAPSSGAPSPAGKPVHVSLKFGDGQVLGVGMPIIAFLSRPISDARAFASATKVTVNGQPVNGAWYFEQKYGDPAHPIEADYRLQKYWPGHAQIHLSLPVKGLSAGKGLVFDNSLTLDFATGVARIVTVDEATHKLTVTADGKVWQTFPVSLGAPQTPTRRGTKVIMEKGRDISMRGPGYFDPHVEFTQRLTYGGEYLHAAPWNVANIERGIDSSNGCTNLLPADAKKLYNFLDVGDPVQFPNANGPLMQLGDGYGDWNIPWSQWRTGGLYPTS